MKIVKTLMVLMVYSKIGFSQSTPPIITDYEILQKQLPTKEGDRFVQGFTTAEITTYLYEPRVQDNQTPHDRDEIYFVMQGNGTLVNGEKLIKFRKGDCLFVAAHTKHKFQDFSEDLSLWVVFYGLQKSKKE